MSASTASALLSQFLAWVLKNFTTSPRQRRSVPQAVHGLVCRCGRGDHRLSQSDDDMGAYHRPGPESWYWIASGL